MSTTYCCVRIFVFGVRKNRSIVDRSLISPAPGVRLKPAGLRDPAKFGLATPVAALADTLVENGLKKVHPLVPASPASCTGVSPAREAVLAYAQSGPPKPASAFCSRSPNESVPS